MNPMAQKWMTFVEKTLWQSSKCYIQMRPRFRLAYSAILCSFLPYCSKLAFEKAFEREPVFAPECAAIGSTNGLLLMGLCLSWDFPIVLSATALGGLYGTAYSLALQ